MSSSGGVQDLQIFRLDFVIEPPNAYCEGFGVLTQNPVQTVFLYVLTKFHDSRPFQLPKDTVLHQESDFQIENNQFLQLDVKNEEKRDEYYQVLI